MHYVVCIVKCHLNELLKIEPLGLPESQIENQMKLKWNVKI